MTVQTYDPSSNGLATNDQSSRGVARIAQWADAAEAAHRLASAICKTTFCPEPYRDKPGEATAAILAGAEVGLSPLAALNAFDPIQGRAAAKAITLRAVVQSYGHEIELVESTDRRCIMRGRRKGAEAWQEVTWTIERAQKLKLAGKQQWQTQPDAMLVARATSQICRLVASDAILGIAYSAEELEDAIAEESGKPVKVRRQPRAELAAPAPQPRETAADDELLGQGQSNDPDPDPVTGEVAAEQPPVAGTEPK